MKQVIFGVGALAVLLTTGGSAFAAGTPCAPEAKKFEWHMCVRADVEYKRGLKTETRDECAIDKVIAKGTCELGDLASYIPEDADPGRVRFYAIVPTDLKLDDFEIQEVSDDNRCRVTDGSFEPYALMKFSDAFDKDNSERSQLVLDNLAKKKLTIYDRALFLKHLEEFDCSGKTAAEGMVDKKTQSKYVFLATVSFKK